MNNPTDHTEETCSVGSLLYSGPECSPRPTIIPLPPGPLSQDIIEVIPNQVEVLKCGGVCHGENSNHKCISTVKYTKTVEVSTTKLVFCRIQLARKRYTRL